MLGIFLDLECNGLDATKHRTLEIAFRICDLETKQIIESYSTLIKQPTQVWNLSDLVSLSINGFSQSTTLNGPSEKEVQSQICELFEKNNVKRKLAIYICQNPSFDRSFFSQIVPVKLQEEMQLPYHWLDLASMFYALEMRYNGKLPIDSSGSSHLSKDMIAKHFELPNEERPHRALNGVDHLIRCYNAVLGEENAINLSPLVKAKA